MAKTAVKTSSRASAMMAGPAKNAATYSIDVTGGSAVIDPGVLRVPAGTDVFWVINQGTARVLFQAADVVDLHDDTATPANPARGTADVAGIHQHSVTVWIGEQTPRVITGVLIVE